MKTDDYEKLGYLTEEFRLFYIKDSEMRSFDYHYHDFDKILFFISGNVSYMIEGKTYTLTPGDIVFVPHSDIHKPHVTFEVPYERFVLYISPDFYQHHTFGSYSLEECFNNVRNGKTYVSHTSATVFEEFLYYLNAILSAQKKSDSPLNDEDYLFSVSTLICLLVAINQKSRTGTLIFSKDAVYDEKIVDIISYINANYTNDLSVEHISSLFYISRYHLMRKFKEVTGYTLHNYISNKRLLFARELINSGEPATTAALNSGFNDYSTFLRAYRKLFAELPVKK